MRVLCPEIATCKNNCYMKPSTLFITSGKKISLNEETTQGDPIAMGMHVLLSTSIISNNTGNLIQVAFADDLPGVSKIYELIEWWKNVL